MKKTWLKGAVKVVFVHLNRIDTNYILYVLKYLMKRTEYKKLFGLIKKCLWDY